jgi:outer membrane lipoprotein LolB
VSALLRAAASAFLFALFFIAGCAQQPLAKAPGSTVIPTWHGRLALRIDSPEQPSFFASFELSGHARAGELLLSGPLGNVVASLRWTPQAAFLRNNGETRAFESLDALATEATGTAIPIAALFQWLDGQPAESAGWQADLSQLAQGRLLARRTHPEPAAELRLILEP